MRTTVVLVALMMVGGCKKATPSAMTPTPSAARTTATAQPAMQPAMPAIDAGLPILEAVHTTCGLGFGGPDSGLQILNRDAGLTAELQRQRPMQCALPDGGVVWTIPGGLSDAERTATVLAHTMAATAVQDPVRFRREVGLLDADMRHQDDATVLPAFLFRAPDRAVGKFVRVEGTAQNVHEANGETTLTIALDLIGREVIEIRYPGVASDRVVNGADVVAYSIAVGSHTVESRHRDGEQVVPEVVALHIEPQAEGSVEDQTQRLLRRVRHHRY